MNIEKIMEGFRYFVVVAGSASIFGCTTNLDRLDAGFGDSVRQMQTAQIYNKAAAENPSPDPISGMDGHKALLDLNQIERPVIAEKQMQHLIKSKTFIIGK